MISQNFNYIEINNEEYAFFIFIYVFYPFFLNKLS